MRAVLICAAWSMAVTARADGLAELKAALARADGGSSLRAMADTRTWRRLGGENAPETGRASALVEDGARALAIIHAKEVLARADAEMRARVRDPDSRTPTLTALDELSARDLMAMVAAAPALLRTIDRSRFKAEKPALHQGRAARQLTFEIAQGALPARERKYASQFTGVFDVWIAADGTPIASRLQQAMSGRAFVVVSFESSHHEETTYAMVGERLLATRKETRTSTSGAGEGDERRVITTLQPQS